MTGHKLVLSSVSPVTTDDHVDERHKQLSHLALIDLIYTAHYWGGASIQVDGIKDFILLGNELKVKGSYDDKLTTDKPPDNNKCFMKLTSDLFKQYDSKVSERYYRDAENMFV